MNKGRFYIRSASDKTDDWPFWFVADEMQSGLNVTQVLRGLIGDRIAPLGDGLLSQGFSVQPFLSDYDALKLCQWANRKIGYAPTGMWADRAA